MTILKGAYGMPLMSCSGCDSRFHSLFFNEVVFHLLMIFGQYPYFHCYREKHFLVYLLLNKT